MQHPDFKTNYVETSCRKIMIDFLSPAVVGIEYVLDVCRPSYRMWIFGYGSLVWRTEFPYVKKLTGYVAGYVRRWAKHIFYSSLGGGGLSV